MTAPFATRRHIAPPSTRFSRLSSTQDVWRLPAPSCADGHAHGLPIEFSRYSQECAGEQHPPTGTIPPASTRTYIDLRHAFHASVCDWDSPLPDHGRAYRPPTPVFANLVPREVYRARACIGASCRTAPPRRSGVPRPRQPESFVNSGLGRPASRSSLTPPVDPPANLGWPTTTFHYSLVQVGAEHSSSRRCCLRVAAKCGWRLPDRRTLEAGDLAELEYQHPFCARTGRLYAGDSSSRTHRRVRPSRPRPRLG